MDLLKYIKINFFRKTEEFSCVEVINLGDNNFNFNFIQIRSKNAKLEIIKREKGIAKFDELKKYLYKDIPIVIAITGNRVLTKKVSIAESDNEKDYLRLVLPNASEKDFLIQTHANDLGAVFCSVVRRRDVEQILKLFTSSDLFVLDVSIGILIINSILQLLDLSQKSRLVLGDYKIQLKNDQIFEILQNKYRKHDQTFLVGNDEIDQDFLIAFASGFQYFVLNRNPEFPDNNLLQQSEFKNYKRYKFIKMAFLLTCFVVLLLNFFFFDHFNNLSSELNNELASYNKLLSKHALLKSELENKDKIVMALGLEQEIRFSFIADKIASTVSVPITLSELNLHPLKSTRKKDFVFIRNKILITGTTKSAHELNEWNKKLRTCEWVKDLTISEFTYSDKDGHALFAIEINTTDNFN